MSQYVLQQWSTEQGFPKGPVYAISQTADGYLWIGTESGLLRFDGLQFRLMQNRLRPVGPVGVLSLAADKDGSLWVGLRDLTLLRYRNGNFEDPLAGFKVSANVTAIGRSQRGELAAAWMQNGLFTYQGARMHVLAAAHGVPRSPITSVAQTGDGDFWMGTRGAGLFRLHSGQTIALRDGLPDPKINCLLADGPKDLWIGTDNGVVRWNGSEITDKGAPDLNRMQVLTLARDRDANLWVGTDSGELFRINQEGISSLHHKSANPDSAITCLFEDREGNLWVGSADGVERLRDTPFVTYSGPEGLPTDGSNPVFADEENRTWFPPEDGGLWWFKGGQHGSVSNAGLEKDVVYSIAGGPGELWVGRQRGGLTRLSSGQLPFTAKNFTTKDGLAQNSVYSVYRDRAGCIWAGTLSGGVSRLSHGSFATYTSVDGLAGNTVSSILESSDGGMWFATPDGLSSLLNGRWRTFGSAQGLPSGNTNCLFEDSASVLWAGTTAGLAFQNSGRFQTPAHVPSFLREQVLGIAQDNFGWLWIATTNHVLRVNRERLIDGLLSDGDVRDFGLADGLRGVEGVKRSQSVIRDSLGRIWFSLNRGISVVDPARLTSNMAPAIAHIQTVSADGVAVEVNDSLRIPAGRQRLVFGFAGLSLSVPERIRYRYKLESFDRGWSEPVAEREAVYTNLGPGAYRFRVAAKNPDGAWNANQAVLAFRIDPAYWQTWWFRTGLLLLAMLTSLALYRLRLRQLTSRLNLRFDERFAERTRIAQELHDTLLQGFLSASMQIHVVANKLPPASPVKPALDRALDLMRQVIDDGRNAVRGLRSSVSGSMDLEEALSRVRDEIAPVDASTESPEFSVTAAGRRVPLHPLLRDEVYCIGREAAINAFRHAKASRIEIELNYSSACLKLLVRDDGRGMDSATLESGRSGHWGLSGMRERADRIGATLRLWSRVDVGTEIELTVPGHIAFQTESSKKQGKLIRWRSSRKTIELMDKPK